MITAIIMASGTGNRFNENKLLYKIKHKPLYSYILDNILSSKIDDIIVISQYDEIFDYCKLNNLKCFFNKNAHIGQSESIKIGIKNSFKLSDYMFFVADQPLLTTKIIDKLIHEFFISGNKITIPTNNNSYLNPKIFPNWTKNLLLELTGESGGRSIIATQKNSIHLVPFKEKKPFMDIDTKEDLELIKQYL